MTDAFSTPFHLPLSMLIMVFLSLPIAYFAMSYAYLAWWHNKALLWNTLIHENGRLTLSESLFYFDHFVACVPMIIVFALCTAGGFMLSGQIHSDLDTFRTFFIAAILIFFSISLISFAFIASIITAGWRRTIDYAYQRIERDGVMSRGGSWNQLQLSNIPIAFGTIGVSSALMMYENGSVPRADATCLIGMIACISTAAALCIGISVFNWCTFKAFLNARWLAHSIRELVTYPFTGIPIALSSILIVEYYLSGLHIWTIEPRPLSLILLAASIVIITIELILLKNTDILTIAQKPSFAANGLSIPYLLCSHVFEHFLDFVLIGPLTGGIYALARLLLTMR